MHFSLEGLGESGGIRRTNILYDHTLTRQALQPAPIWVSKPHGAYSGREDGPADNDSVRLRMRSQSFPSSQGAAYPRCTSGGDAAMNLLRIPLKSSETRTKSSGRSRASARSRMSSYVSGQTSRHMQPCESSAAINSRPRVGRFIGANTTQLRSAYAMRVELISADLIAKLGEKITPEVTPDAAEIN